MFSYQFLMLYKIFPVPCILCQMPCYGDICVCNECLNDLPYLNEQTNYENSAVKYYALFQYCSPIDKLLIDLKFHNKLLYARVFGRLLCQKIADKYRFGELPNCIIPMPLHTNRLKERGFNQALELAKPVGKKLNIPIDKYSCERIKNTEAQSTLQFKQRQKNVRHAFHVTQEIVAKQVIVVDDVMTSGSTVEELCKELLKSGVSKIDVWCVARAGYAN